MVVSSKVEGRKERGGGRGKGERVRTHDPTATRLGV